MAETLSSFFRNDRISSGIEELDIILEGGYQSPGTTIILGTTSQEKLAFAFHFAYAGINTGEKVIYITFDMSPNEIESKANVFGMDFKTHTGKELIFIDAYSYTIRVKPEGRNDIIVPGPAALNDLSLALNDVIGQIKDKRIRVIFHSLSTLSLYSQPDVIIKFLQVVQGKLKGINATNLWFVDEEICDKKFMSVLESISDQKFSISDNVGAHELNIAAIPMPISIRVGAAGIEIL